MSGLIRHGAIAFYLFGALLVPNVTAETIEAFTEPFRVVELAAGDSGILAEVLVQDGDTVDAGQLLVSLDNRVLDATLAVAKQKAAGLGNITVAQAELELRNERLDQVRTLRQRGHATQRELSRAETDVAVAQARVGQAQDEQLLSQLDCKRIQAQISHRQIVSPFAGVITMLHRKRGEPTLVTDPRIVTLVQLDQLRAKFSATPSQVAKLRKNQVVSVVLADSSESVKATIERISRTIDAKSGTLELHVVINNAKDQIRSGARCLMEVDAGNVQTVMRSQPAATETLETAVFGTGK